MQGLTKSSAVITAVLLLSVWSSALAGVVCPHMPGACCMAAASEPGESHLSMIASAGVHEQSDHGKIHHHQSSSVSEPARNHCQKNGLKLNSVSVVESQEGSCSVCVTNSQSRGAISTPFASQNFNNRATIPDDTASSLPCLVDSSLPAADVQDHSPPGNTNRKHILLSVFRI